MSFVAVPGSCGGFHKAPVRLPATTTPKTNCAPMSASASRGRLHLESQRHLPTGRSVGLIGKKSVVGAEAAVRKCPASAPLVGPKRTSISVGDSQDGPPAIIPEDRWLQCEGPRRIHFGQTELLLREPPGLIEHRR